MNLLTGICRLQIKLFSIWCFNRAPDRARFLWIILRKNVFILNKIMGPLLEQSLHNRSEGHNINFYGQIWKIIKLITHPCLIPLLI